MFTGIVTDVGDIVSATPTAQGKLHRLRIACRYDRAGIADGASIACNGVCLTVVGTGTDGGRTWFEVDAAAETLRLTTARHWSAGTKLNLERALKIGDELGGHIVAGHVDGIAAKSCTLLALQCEGAKITTIEGLAEPGGALHPMQEAFRDNHGLQCGYCTPGMIMAALDIVRRRGNDLDEHTIREQLDGNICRCTGYHNIVKAIAAGAKAMAKGGTRQAAE